MKFECGSFSVVSGTDDLAINLIMGGILGLAFLYSCWWAYWDGKVRGRNPWLTILFIILAGWPFSIWFWKWLRPERKITDSVFVDRN